MRKWFLPVTVFGLGGIAALFLSDRGRQTFWSLFENMEKAPDALLDFNDFAQRELDRIQLALNQVAESLEIAR